MRFAWRPHYDASPLATPVSRPLAVTVILLALFVCHCVWAVTSVVLPSDHRAFSVSCCDSRGAILDGATSSVVTSVGVAGDGCGDGGLGRVGESSHDTKTKPEKQRGAEDARSSANGHKTS